LTEEELPVGQVADWAVLPSCGAVVTFTGTARDHAEGRPDVTGLAYEAYESQVGPRFHAIVDEARRQWPDLGRVAVLHRTGPVAIGEASVVVAASSPHREAAFEAARWCIDSLKATAPIWKRETWAGGESWGLDARELSDLSPDR
jgi:molybdopterin synthase catalytic subunit